MQCLLDLGHGNHRCRLACRRINDQRQTGIIQLQLTGQGRFRHPGHADDVATITLQTSDLGNGFQPWPLGAGIHAVAAVTNTFSRQRCNQLLTQRLDMGRGRPGTKQNAQAFKSFGTSSIPNPMAMILQQPDSLKLTRKQADSLATLSTKYSRWADSVWSPIAKTLEAEPDHYSRGEAYKEYVHAREQTVDYLLGVAPDVRGLLTPAQKRKLPPAILNFLDDRVLKFLRSSSAGDGGNIFIR